MSPAKSKTPNYADAKPVDPRKRKRIKRKHEVAAAGGVVTRFSKKGNLKVVLVHRPGYRDWSLPKGKLDRKESFKRAAVREVCEETGLRCRLGEELDPCYYRDGKGRMKLVRWWHMTPRKGSISDREPDGEVDKVRWVKARKALRKLDYEHDRELVRSVMEMLGGDPEGSGG